MSCFIGRIRPGEFEVGAGFLLYAALGGGLPVPLRRCILVIEPANFFEIDSRLWQLEVHVIQRIGNDLGYREITKTICDWKE